MKIPSRGLIIAYSRNTENQTIEEAQANTYSTNRQPILGEEVVGLRNGGKLGKARSLRSIKVSTEMVGVISFNNIILHPRSKRGWSRMGGLSKAVRYAPPRTW